MPEFVTAAILLGASIFPKHNYPENVAFLRSKQDLRSYLQDDEVGLNLRDEAILDLFDSQLEPSGQLKAIGKFLDHFSQQVAPEVLRNLLVYYVGHGYFCGRRQEYHVALASIETAYESTTGLKIVDLADEIKQKARTFRRFIILDCCFAAEALSEFQGAAEAAIAVKVNSAFAEEGLRRAVEVPRRGTALFCAADKDNVARSPKDLPHTMFTDALLDVLYSGDSTFAPELNFNDLRDLIWDRLQAISAEPIRPVLYAPDQCEGDIASNVMMFPNAWHRHAMKNADSPSSLHSELVSKIRTSASMPKRPGFSSVPVEKKIGQEQHSLNEFFEASHSRVELVSNHLMAADATEIGNVLRPSHDESRRSTVQRESLIAVVGYGGVSVIIAVNVWLSFMDFFGAWVQEVKENVVLLAYMALCVAITAFIHLTQRKAVWTVASAWTCCTFIAALYSWQGMLTHSNLWFLISFAAVACYLAAESAAAPRQSLKYRISKPMRATCNVGVVILSAVMCGSFFLNMFHFLVFYTEWVKLAYLCFCCLITVLLFISGWSLRCTYLIAFVCSLLPVMYGFLVVRPSLYNVSFSASDFISLFTVIAAITCGVTVVAMHRLWGSPA